MWVRDVKFSRKVLKSRHRWSPAIFLTFANLPQSGWGLSWRYEQSSEKQMAFIAEYLIPSLFMVKWAFFSCQFSPFFNFMHILWLTMLILQVFKPHSALLVTMYYNYVKQKWKCSGKHAFHELGKNKNRPTNCALIKGCLNLVWELYRLALTHGQFNPF